jgi:organic hydroperoxide reductase OsmC/OhrA
MGHDAHRYSVTTTWTGNRGTGTSGYRSYGRDHEINAGGKSAAIAGSSTPVYRGDADRYNPEELLIASLSACHMLWYLHLCADAGIVVTEYSDEAQGELRVGADGSGQFTSVFLRPSVTITDPGKAAAAAALHHRAHDLCFIARSVNFPVRCEPTTHA